MAHEIVVADILDWAKTYDGPKFHALVCDPPYHLTSIVKRFGGKDAAPAQQGSDGRFSRLSRGFMGQEWDGGDVAFRPETWAAIGQHLLPGAHLLAFGGTRTWHRLAVAIEDAGFEIRDTLMWLYGSGFPKSHDVSKGLDKAAGAQRTEVIGQGWHHSTGKGVAMQGNAEESWPKTYENGDADRGEPVMAPATDAARQWEGYGTALKPAWEPIIVARKALDGTVAETCVEHGCGALNIDGCRVPSGALVQSSAGKGAPFGPGAYPKGEGRIYQGEGRWPANVLHDGSPEVVAGFPLGESRKGAPRGSANPGNGWGMTKTGAEYDDAGSASRFFYTAKADTDERERGLLGAVPCMAYGKPGVIHDPDGDGGLITKRHFTVDDKGRPVYSDCRRNPHPTIKPLDLLRYLSLLILPPPGDEPRRILVPFAGVGSEMIGARQAGWDDVLGIEIVKSYADIAVIRLAAWMGML